MQLAEILVGTPNAGSIKWDIAIVLAFSTAFLLYTMTKKRFSKRWPVWLAFGSVTVVCIVNLCYAQSTWRSYRSDERLAEFGANCIVLSPVLVAGVALYLARRKAA